MRRALLTALVLVILTGSVGEAQTFAAAELKGAYAFGFEGLENGQHVVSTGVMEFDGVGAVTGKAFLRRAGFGNCDMTIRNSTYRVEKDGTGFLALGFFGDAPCTTSVAIHLNIAATSVSELVFSSAQGTFAGRATRRGNGPFSTATVKGTYAFRLSGVDGFDQTVATGVMTLDGAGKVNGRATFKKEGGGACTGTIRDSTYGVNEDGRGFMALGFFPDACAFQQALPLSIAVFRSSERGFELVSNGNSMYAGTARVQVPPKP